MGWSESEFKARVNPVSFLIITLVTTKRILSTEFLKKIIAEAEAKEK
jgi:hypothetical protein